jgi:pimeloyl-ACP methyl ester carboxylesterase
MPEISNALYRAGEGETVVLLHGFTATWHCWKPVLADLVPRYDVVAPTLAGHAGGPDYPAGQPMTLPGAADSLEGHLDEIGVGKAHFVGNSMGGALSIEMAKRGRAHSVVALSPGGGWQPGGSEPHRIAKFFARSLALTRASDTRLPRVMASARGRRLALRDVMRRGQLVAPADAVDLARGSLGCVLADDVLRLLKADGAHLTGLDEVSAPVLLAWAEFDRILPMRSCSWRLRREIPDAEFRVLPGVGHVPMWDDARLITDTIVDWVTRHAAVPATA